MQTINFGIDLGTTNSLIAKYGDNGVEIFKNPVGLKDTIPSCVAFRNEKIIVGEKAREWLLKDPLNVFSSFKRKMGTDESFYISSKDITISPIALSALVLKELKSFIHTGENPTSVIITIPASFDTIQSNATKTAGLEAGFKEVVLLQEPIAASLAFFNNQYANTKDKGKWLVYDLGGGTFDIALIGIDNGEMKVIDHQGDNYLGGVDFDHFIVSNIILPKLIKETNELDIAEKVKSRQSKYEKLYFILLFKAEEAKKELSNIEETEIEFTYINEDGKEEDISLTISRNELNEILKEKIDGTVQMIFDILERNNLKIQEIEEIIMIGGSTYIPFVRETVSIATGININTKADPTTAVAVGSAYFAGNKPITFLEPQIEHNELNSLNLKIKLGYNTSTKDAEEYVSASVENFKNGLFYRITRLDGGYDSGLKTLSPTFGEFLILSPNKKNSFEIKIFDVNSNLVEADVPKIEITNGLFSLYGQPLPEDICIEIDDLSNNATKCEVIFTRNSILPLTKTIYKEISKTIKKNSSEVLFINILEGDANQHPSTNKAIGLIEIKSEYLENDLIKGSDVEIIIEMSESRDISVKLHLNMTNQSFNEVFSPTTRYVSVSKLRTEISEIKTQLNLELEKAIRNDDFEHAGLLQEKIDKATTLINQTKSLDNNSFTDEKYQIDESKRKIAQELYANGTKNSNVYRSKEELYQNLEHLQSLKNLYSDIPEKFTISIDELLNSKQVISASNSYFQIEGFNSRCNTLIGNIYLNTPTLLTFYFHHFSKLSSEKYKNYRNVENELKKGEKALDRKNYEELKVVVLNINNELIESENIETKIMGTGLS